MIQKTNIIEENIEKDCIFTLPSSSFKDKFQYAKTEDGIEVFDFFELDFNLCLQHELYLCLAPLFSFNIFDKSYQKEDWVPSAFILVSMCNKCGIYFNSVMEKNHGN